MMIRAARMKDSGERNDVEASMAKLIASEYCAEVTTQSLRIHGGYGFSKKYEIERLMREAPFLLIGEPHPGSRPRRFAGGSAMGR